MPQPDSSPSHRVPDLVLGRSGFGGAPLGNLYAALDEDVAQATLARAWQRGLRYFDTAPHYGNGLSECRMGRYLREQPRDAFVLSTKVGRILRADASTASDQNGYRRVLPYASHYDYSYDGALRSFDDSRKRLGLARIDIVYVHDIDVRTHGRAQPRRYREAIEGALPALVRLRNEHVIGAIGLGVNEWEVCLDALHDADIDMFLLAGRYTLLDQSASTKLLPACRQRGARVVVGGPYNSGILATGAVPGACYDYADATAAVIGRVRGIEAVCAEFRVPMRAAALQFPMAHPAVTCVIPGARSPAEVDDAVDMRDVRIPAAFWQTLRAAGLLALDAPVPS